MSAFFFFQAEDGIRDIGVTGVQTCVFRSEPLGGEARGDAAEAGDHLVENEQDPVPVADRAQPLEVPDRRDAHPGRDRKRVGLGKSGRPGGRRVIKKKNTYTTYLTCSSLTY